MLFRKYRKKDTVSSITQAFTLGVQINVRVQINVLAGKLVKNNKCMGPNKGTGWKC